jgi:hypothetical protein
VRLGADSYGLGLSPPSITSGSGLGKTQPTIKAIAPKRAKPAAARGMEFKKHWRKAMKNKKAATT